MSISETWSRLKKLDALIRQERAGTATTLSEQLGISVRSVHAYLKVLRTIEGPIRYDRKSKRYKYAENKPTDR